MSTNRLTDYEVVEFLKMLDRCGGNAAACRALGLTTDQGKTRAAVARDRKLTADTPVSDPLAAAEAQVRLLNKQLAGARREADTAESIRKTIYDLSARAPEPPAWLLNKHTESGTRGTPMCLWSDWHYGEVVNPEEVGGLNKFNAEVAAERIRRLVDTTIDLCFHHMGSAAKEYPGVVVCLGGDMISGDIHEELLATNERTPQQCINELTDLIASGLERMADAFGKVFVPCVVGNHGRNTKKPRMKGRVYTSHEWNIYCNLERYFRRDDRIQFLIPGETDAYFKVYDHRFLLTHGDSLGVKGGDGIIGAIGPIMRGSIKVSNSEAQIGKNVDTILMGHWHQMLWLPGAIVNGALKGYDEYARLALRAPYSAPSQALWFVHPKHGITARWEVLLDGPAKSRHNDDEQWLSWRKSA